MTLTLLDFFIPFLLKISFVFYFSQKFYDRLDIAKIMPEKRYATKKHGAGRAMNMTLKEAYMFFKVKPFLSHIEKQ